MLMRWRWPPLPYLLPHSLPRLLAYGALLSCLIQAGPAVAQGLLSGNSQAMALPMPTIIHPDGAVRGGDLAGSGFGAAARLGADGHFRFEARLNGVPVTMLFDTGASFISLRAEDAARLNIDPASLNYSLVMNTANGRTKGAPITLASVTIGGITRSNVRAVVHQAGGLSDNLLGQSFLSRLTGYRQTGDRLVLIGGE